MTTGAASEAGFAHVVRALGHDLRTPLNAILGYSDMLAEDLESQELSEPASDARRIHQAARNLLAQIDALVQLARVTGDGIHKGEEEIDWVMVFEDASRQVTSIGGGAIPIEIYGEDARPVAGLDRGDAYHLADAFLRAAAEWAGGESLTVRLIPGSGQTGMEFSVEVPAPGVTEEELSALQDGGSIGGAGHRGIYFKTVLAICRQSGGRCEIGRTDSGKLEFRAAVGTV